MGPKSPCKASETGSSQANLAIAGGKVAHLDAISARRAGIAIAFEPKKRTLRLADARPAIASREIIILLHYD